MRADVRTDLDYGISIAKKSCHCLGNMRLPFAKGAQRGADAVISPIDNDPIAGSISHDRSILRLSENSPDHVRHEYDASQRQSLSATYDRLQ